MPTQPVQKDEPRFSKLKFAFLYVLIGGLVISAVISVVAILIGEFNSVVQKALLTTFVLVVHSLLVLAIVWADTRNILGKSLIATTILAAVLANMFTSTFGIWDIWGEGSSWNAFHIYMLFIGAAFIITAVLKLRLAHQLTTVMSYVSVALIGLFTLLFVPWIVADNNFELSDFYFRAVGAAGILAATSLVITAIVNRIAVAQNHALRARSDSTPLPGGMLAIYITVGVIVSLFWTVGFFAFMVDAANTGVQTQPETLFDGPKRDYRY